MNKTTYLTSLLVLLSICSSQAQKKKSPFQWTLQKERLHNKYRNDATKWSKKNWEADTKDWRLRGRPMANGVFPVPAYHLVDSTFNGLGNFGDWKGIKTQGKTVIYHSLYVKQCHVNEKFIPNKPNEVFFTIVSLTDTVDLKRYSHTSVSISSRNHPHYVGEGFIKTKRNRIDFVSFITADRNAYALVNMRLFDLRIGRIILIAPQKDGTLRSLQLESSVMSFKEMDKYIHTLLSQDKNVIKFFTQSGNI